jgi:predicted ATPase/class 3 adenylate cyclase
MSEANTVSPTPSAAPSPSGTLTFLFTDIEGSTQRWERDRAAMQDAVRRHDELVRATIVSNGGVVFKTVGDAFYAIFELAPKAAQAALSVQAAISDADFGGVGGLAVRIALHTGNADERGGDYFGPALNRVARLLSTGYGGQTVLSGVTAGLIEGQLPPGAILHDLGMHRLKDLERPEHVHQLSAQGTRHEYPPLKSLDASPNNLPVQLTSFVERDRDIAEITELLEEHRVVTLVGSGGVGKTRISLQVGANLIDHNDDGVWFVELAPLTDPALVPSTIASTIGLTLPVDGDPTSALITPLISKRMLLILDNCEHLLSAASNVASAIARGCPKVSILSSSRQALGIAGEVTYRIPSLLFPNAAEAASLQALDIPKYGALSLFVSRAQAAQTHFTVTDENAPVIAEICRRLDGIALAIELAAPRVRMLSLVDLRDRLNERFRVLTGGSRDLLPRQQTLRAAIDWSFDLLNDEERKLFSRLVIFADGFTLEAANFVCNFETLDDLDLLETLSSLVDKSLIVADLDGPTSRYRMLETTRAYAREKLTSEDQVEPMADRHLQYFRELSNRGRDALYERGPGHISPLYTELENARAAVAWSFQSGQPASGASILVGGGEWEAQESIELAEAFLKNLSADAHHLRAELWDLIGWVEATHGNRKRFPQVLEQALLHARLAHHDHLLVDKLTRRALVMCWDEDRDEDAQRLIQEAAVIAGDSVLMRYAVLWARVDISRRFPESLDAAVLLANQLREVACLLPDYPVGEGFALDFLSYFEFKRGNLDRAIHSANEALSIAERSIHPHARHLRSRVLESLPGFLIHVNDTAGAIEMARKSLAAAMNSRDAKDIWAITNWAIEAIAFSLALNGNWSSVALLTGHADANVPSDAHVGDRWAEKPNEYLALLHGHYAPNELAKQLAEGAALSKREAVSLALQATSPTS